MDTTLASPALVDDLNEQAWRWRHADTRRALALTRRALAFADAIDYDAGRAYAALRMALCEHILADTADGGEARLRQALADMQILGDTAGESEALNLLGNLLSTQGNAEEALQTHRRCLALREAGGGLDDQAGSLNNMALALRQLGRADEARECLLRSLGLAEAAANHRGQAYATVNLGLVALDAADDADGDPLRESWRRAHLDQAAQHLENGFTLAARTEDRALQCTAQTGLARTRIGQDQLAAAQHLLVDALALAKRIGNAGDLLRAQMAVAELLRAQGHVARAEEQFRALVAPLQHCREHALEPVLWLHITRCALAGGRPAQARDSLQTLQALLAQGRGLRLRGAAARLATTLDGAAAGA